MDEQLRKKIESVFGALVVDKRQALQAGFETMPRFVTEFLLAEARAKNAGLGMADVRQRIARFSVDADRKNAFLSDLMRTGKGALIALLEVEPRLDRNEHVGRIPQLDGEELAIRDRLVETYKELLYGGLWGSCVLSYQPGERVTVEEFTPYQLTRPDMEMFKRARGEFTLDEWTDLLITSAGYRPEAFPTFRLKTIALTRLIPLTQGNLNLIEFGPRGTGKSYLLRNLSARAYVLSGAKTTPAQLLYDLQKKRLGIVGTKKVVVFDEVAATSFPDRNLVAQLKDYMESGQIARGGRSFVGDSSLVFTGNIELDGDGRSPSRQYMHLFEGLPGALRDVAIGDRIHGFIPGWEMPKISDQVLADGVGFLSDYFGEVLTELRKDHTVMDYLKANCKLSAGATTRDQNAVEKIAAGLLRLIYPDGRIGEEGLHRVLQVAVELRQRVHRQLERMAPGEFKPKVLSFAGIEAHVAPDLGPSHSLEYQDVVANGTDQVGKITILLVGGKGGGDVGFVECVHVEGSKGLSVTGLHGAELKHSVQSAYDALLHQGREFGLGPERLAGRRMSVHLVNIGEPKDGPSAGLAFALAMLSAATGRPIRRQLAVTGELSTQGNVNAVGGIAEKLTAAAQHGRRVVLIPADNAAELVNLRELAERLDVRPVRTLKEAVDLVFETEAPADNPTPRREPSTSLVNPTFAS